MPPATKSGENLTPEAPIAAESALRPDASTETTRPSKRQHLENIHSYLEVLHDEVEDRLPEFMLLFSMDNKELRRHVVTLTTLLEVISKELHQQPNTAYSTPQIVLELLNPLLENLKSFLEGFIGDMKSVGSLVEKYYWLGMETEDRNGNCKWIVLDYADESGEWATKAIARIEEGLNKVKAKGDWDPESFAEPPKNTATWA